MQDKEKDSAARIKKFMTMMDSMTNKELDSSEIKLWQTESRIMRIARGAGVHPNYVGELIGQPRLPAPASHPLCSPSCCTRYLASADGRRGTVLQRFLSHSGSALHLLLRQAQSTGQHAFAQDTLWLES